MDDGKQGLGGRMSASYQGDAENFQAVKLQMFSMRIFSIHMWWLSYTKYGLMLVLPKCIILFELNIYMNAMGYCLAYYRFTFNKYRFRSLIVK